MHQAISQQNTYKKTENCMTHKEKHKFTESEWNRSVGYGTVPKNRKISNLSGTNSKDKKSSP